MANRKEVWESAWILSSSSTPTFCCRTADPFQGPKACSWLTLRNELSGETHVLTKQELLSGKAPGRRAGGQGNPGEPLRSLGLVMGLVSGWSLANRSNSQHFLVVHTSLSQEGRQWEGFWELAGHAVSPFDLSRTLPVGGSMLLTRTSLLKQPMQMVTMAPGRDEQLQTACFP